MFKNVLKNQIKQRIKTSWIRRRQAEWPHETIQRLMNSRFSKTRWFVQSSVIGNAQASTLAPVTQKTNVLTESSRNINCASSNFLPATSLVQECPATLTCFRPNSRRFKSNRSLRPRVLYLHPSLASQCLEPNGGAAGTQPRDVIVCTSRKDDLWME